jgi:EpsI family protein
MIKLWVALAVLGLHFYIFEFMASREVIPPRESFDEFPLQLGDWTCPERKEMAPDILKTLGASDYLLCDYTNQKTDGLVRSYVGYHETQVREGGGGHQNVIHTPEHCLPGSGWDIINSSLVPLDIEGLPEGHGLRADEPQAKRFIIAKGDARELVYFWYQGQGRVITNNEDVILFRFWNRATKGRTDGALVRFVITIVRGDVEQAEEQFRSFAPLFAKELGPYVPD